MEDEIDLRRYLAVLLRHWKLIVIVTVLAGAAALAVNLLTPQVYEAKSRVAIIKGNAVLPSTGALQATGGAQVITREFADLMLSLAKAPAIADAAAAEPALKAGAAELTAAKISAAVQAKLQGNTVEFTVQYPHPAAAALIANAWARQYVDHVERFFRTAGQTPQEARSYADSVKKIYAEKQKAIVDFEAAGQAAATQGGLEDRDIQLIDLVGQRDSALKAYQAALARISDAEVAQATTGGYVRVADLAVAPQSPLPDNRKWPNVIVALVAGLIVGILGAFAVEYFCKMPAKSRS